MDGRRSESVKDGFGLRMNTSRAHKLPQAIASDGGGLKLAFAAYELGRALPNCARLRRHEYFEALKKCMFPIAKSRTIRP
jgi:hypothetical protein